MPTYVHLCKKGHRFDVFLRLKDYDKPQKCKCGSASRRVIVPTMIAPDMANWDRYISPATGKLITSYKDRREDMAESGCVDYEPSLKSESVKRTQKNDEKLEKAMDETVEREIEKMTTPQRERLDVELSHGADINISRQERA